MIDIETARLYYDDQEPAHGFEHVLRVLHLAMRIAQEEGADSRIVQTAALLHDVGRAEELRTGACHAQLSAERARQVLMGHPPAQVEAVAQAIAQHRFRGEQGPSSLEAQVLYDADKLDAMGAIGVARAYAMAGVRQQKLWASVPATYAARTPEAGRRDLHADEHTPVHEYLFKLVKLRDRMYTVTGKRLADGRHEFMVAYFQRLEREIAGEV